MRTFARTLERTGVLQVDSVNVLQRAHYMPLFSRMGPYDVDLLTRAARAEAAPAGRVLGARAGADAGRAVAGDAAPDGVLPRPAGQVVAARSTTTSSSRPARRDRRPRRRAPPATSTTALPRDKENWGWNWSETTQGARLPLHDRRGGHRRPQQPVRGPLRPARAGDPGRRARRCRRRRLEEADLELVAARPRVARRGDGPRAWPTTTGCRSRRRRQPAVDELVEAGELLPVQIEGWNRPAYLHRDARRPRRVDARALLSPFDPVVWLRERTEQLFDFHYRIEIYTPADKRVLRLLRAAVPARRRDRRPGRPQGRPARSGRLVVKAAYAEDGAPEDTAEELSAELRPAGRLARPGRHHGRAAGRPGAAAPSLSSRLDRVGTALAAPGSARIAAPSRAAAARCGPSASSSAITGASSSGRRLLATPPVRRLPPRPTLRPTMRLVESSGPSASRRRAGRGRAPAWSCRGPPWPDDQRGTAASARRAARAGGPRTLAAAAQRRRGRRRGPVVTTTGRRARAVASRSALQALAPCRGTRTC